MFEFILFWAAKAIAEVIVGLLVLLGVVVIVALSYLPGYLHKKVCKHEKYRETRACDAICVNCGKNLGFIQGMRIDNPEGEI